MEPDVWTTAGPDVASRRYPRGVPLPVFEITCAVIVVATLLTMARSRDRRALALDYATLAVAAYAGEQSCITLYRFYAYADAWHGRLGSVPVLVPLIWPLVILSARDVARALLPPGAGRVRAALAVLAIVSFDASLVEVVAVRAGLWSWAEPGHLGVPLVGVLGWGYFAFGASLPLGRVAGALAGLAATHGLVLASWWAVFRWTARGELGAAGFAPLAAASALGTFAALRARRQGRAMGPEVWAPRVLAAGLFFVLLATTAPGEPSLLAHAALVAVPYLAATSLRGTRSPGAPRGATPPSPRGRGAASPSRGA